MLGATMADDTLIRELRSLNAELESLRARYAREITDLWRAQANLEGRLVDILQRSIDRDRDREMRDPPARSVN
jgi:hypothetical protein